MGPATEFSAGAGSELRRVGTFWPMPPLSRRVVDVASLLLSLNLERFSGVFKAAELTLPTLCETLHAGGRSAVDSVLKEAGFKAVGPRVRVENTLQDPHVCPKPGSSAELPTATLVEASPPPPPPPPPPKETEVERRSTELKALLDRLSLQRFANKLVNSALDVPTLCETLQTGGRSAVDDVLIEAGMATMGPRIRLANALFELPGYSCRPTGERGGPGGGARPLTRPRPGAPLPCLQPPCPLPELPLSELPQPAEAAEAGGAPMSRPSSRPDAAHEGRSVESTLQSQSPPMEEFKAKFDEAGVDLAEVCAIWRKGGKWALMEKFSAMAITITRQHPRPRYKLAIGFTQACSS